MDNGASSYHRFLTGDWDGLTEIVEEYYKGLVLYLNTFVSNLQDAEDMAEETLFVLSTQKPDFTGKSSFKTWLYGIGRNVTCARLRKNHGTVPLSPEDMSVLVAEEQDAAKEFFRDEEKRALHRCLSRLRQDFRQVLWLRYFEDMSAAEIAAVMNKTVFGVNQLTARAKKALRKEMEKEGYLEKN